MADLEYSRHFTTVLMISIAMLVVAPAAYLLIAMILEPPDIAGEGFNDFVLYILMIVAVAQPAVVLVIQKTIQRPPKTDDTGEESGAVGRYFAQSMLKMAIVEVVYIYGLVMFLISGKLSYMLYFYPIGIVWTLIFWPRRSVFEKPIVENHAS